MAHVDDQRVARVLDALEAQHPGAQLLVNDPWSIYYLTGFYADMFERFCGVLLARGAEPVILVNALHQLLWGQALPDDIARSLDMRR